MRIVKSKLALLGILGLIFAVWLTPGLALGAKETQEGTGTETTEAADNSATQELPGTPTDLAISCGYRGLTIQWSSVEEATGYRVYRVESDGTLTKIKTTTANSFVDKKAKENGTSYTYQVKSVAKTDGHKTESALSDKITGIYLQTPVMSSVKREGKQVTVQWDANKKSRGYQVQFSYWKDFRKYKKLNVRSASTVSASMNKLKTNRDVYVRVRSFRKVGKSYSYSDWSNVCAAIHWNSQWEFASYSAIHSGYTYLYETSVKPSKKKNITVCINAGHGTSGGERKKTLCHPNKTAKVTGGSTAAGSLYAISVSSGTQMLNGDSEAVATLAAALQTKQALLEAGYNVLMIRETSDAQFDNIARTVMANNMADCHIAIHYDSTTSNVGAFACIPPNIRSYLNMYPVSKHYKEHRALGTALIAGLKKKGAKVSSSPYLQIDLTQTSYSTVPSVDMEIGDRAADRSAKTLQRIAAGLAAGLNQYYS